MSSSFNFGFQKSNTRSDSKKKAKKQAKKKAATANKRKKRYFLRKYVNEKEWISIDINSINEYVETNKNTMYPEELQMIKVELIEILQNSRTILHGGDPQGYYFIITKVPKYEEFQFSDDEDGKSNNPNTVFSEIFKRPLNQTTNTANDVNDDDEDTNDDDDNDDKAETDDPFRMNAAATVSQSNDTEKQKNIIMQQHLNTQKTIFQSDTLNDNNDMEKDNTDKEEEKDNGEKVELKNIFNQKKITKESKKPDNNNDEEDEKPPSNLEMMVTFNLFVKYFSIRENEIKVRHFYKEHPLGTIVEDEKCFNDIGYKGIDYNAEDYRVFINEELEKYYLTDKRPPLI